MDYWHGGIGVLLPGSPSIRESGYSAPEGRQLRCLTVLDSSRLWPNPPMLSAGVPGPDDLVRVGHRSLWPPFRIEQSDLSVTRLVTPKGVKGSIRIHCYMRLVRFCLYEFSNPLKELGRRSPQRWSHTELKLLCVSISDETAVVPNVAKS